MSQLWKAPPAPPTPLGCYRVLSSLAGIRVSPLQLGAMSIGDKWANFGMGSMDKESSFRLLDAYYDAGGNFIDTASNYQDGTSEMFIGEWAEMRGIRDQLVIATKYTNDFKRGDDRVKVKANYAGNNAKSLKISVEASLEKLRTSYIDILYVHWWDYQTSMEEVMDNLHHLVAAGRVLYLGASDMPAWVVAAANQYAKCTGKTPFVIYQGAWNVMERSFEREIIPMARANGLALAPWNVLAGGRLRSDSEEQRRLESGEKGRTITQSEWMRNENEKKMSAALEKKTPYVFPIIGGRKVEHLMANIEALKISLSDEQIHYLESAIPFDPGFPVSHIGDGTPNRKKTSYESVAAWDRWPISQPIKPSLTT
ncbi:arylalcohol dehydrogenase [Fomitiporia mediterranea MF3/22]|uniref:arylalcohol dehydrogenase n=1 Tax=Fomitiporia mediterranea (strain MF3/22) TaxID=694068 RepID=UPI0004407409|nr:arylalcohol dehydrogenase [Fomitiporia mediterranea MF3/22]EJD04772.1 arylalcohol dehydrogenase [Fomitiporia mediterranea MF3/22]